MQPVPAASTFYVKDYMEKAKLFGTSVVLLQFCGTSFVMCGGGETDETKNKTAKRGAGSKMAKNTKPAAKPAKKAKKPAYW